MYDYIIGKVAEVWPDKIVLENNGIGYALTVSSNASSVLKVHDTAKLYTRMIVREDEIYLCGFISREEEKMFELLTSVSKIGPRVGLGILSYAKPSVLSAYIAGGDVKMLQQAPGVGKKTAERIVLELKDKVDAAVGVPTGQNTGNESADNSSDMNMESQAILGLVQLGYSRSEAQEACSNVREAGDDTELIIKKALKYLLRM